MNASRSISLIAVMMFAGGLAQATGMGRQSADQSNPNAMDRPYGAGSSGLTNQQSAAHQGQQETRQFRGKVVALQGDKIAGQPTALKVSTDQGELSVMTGTQWDQKKEQLKLNVGDDVEITGFLSGFGEQRHIMAQQITANGQTVVLDSEGRPYRETGREEGATGSNTNAPGYQQQPQPQPQRNAPEDTPSRW